MRGIFSLGLIKKTIVYVDGFNLYYSLKSTPYKWLDIRKLLELVLGADYDIIQIKYFSALVKATSKDKSKPERQMVYWRALECSKGLEIILGRFKTRQVNGTLLKPLGKGIERGEMVKVQKYEEKESDVNIASQILLDCHKTEFNCVILLSNDTDLKKPLSFARKHFHKQIGIISPNKNTHNDLKKISHFNKNITEKILRESQLPKQVERFVKPEKWS